MPMLAKGKAANARMWVYVGDEARPYNIFDFTLNRGRDGPSTFSKITGRFCWPTPMADTTAWWPATRSRGRGAGRTRRRKFVDAEKAAPEIAREAVELVRALYAVEHRGKNLSVGARLELRQADSAPVLAELKEKLLTWKQQLLPKHPMAEAVNYALGQWEELNVFCSDGAVPIDNNVSEREMKRVVLNRKNSLFVGNARGGRTAAILASLTSSCRRHDVDPQRYLTQLLVNLPAARLSDLPAWLPDEWKRRQTAPPDCPVAVAPPRSRMSVPWPKRIDCGRAGRTC